MKLMASGVTWSEAISRVAFVFAVFIVHQDDDAAGAHVGHDVFDGRNGNGVDGRPVSVLMALLSMGLKLL
jgi:hypothetical protein